MRDQLITVLLNQLEEADVTTSEVGQQRERNYRYYSLQPLGNERRGRSHYVDPTVLSSIESKKAIFAETFLSSRQVVKFTGGDNPDEAKAKTAYVNGVFRKNNYERLLRDAWHDSMVSKRCVVWVDWTRDSETSQITVQGAPSQYVNQQIEQAGEILDVDDSQLQSMPIPSIGQPQFIHTGTIKVEVDASYTELDLIAPEKFYQDPNAAYIDEAQWITQEVEVSKDTLIDEGYDPDQVSKLSLEYSYSGKEEDYARKAHDQSYTSSYKSSNGDNNELVTIYKTRAWLALEEDSVEGFTPDNALALYEIHWTKNGVLQFVGEEEITPAIKVIDEMGCFSWAEYKISHAEMGMCTADIEAASQKNQSIIKRGIIDNLSMVNNTRYEAVHDRLLNPRDMLDNIIGGVVFTDAIGSVAALAQPPLSPMTMPTLEMLKRDSEERSGMSSLSRGMNSDAISNQNADNMIQRLTTAGQRRVTTEARDFAKTFLIPLMQHVVKLGMENDKSSDQMESGGKIIPIVPSQWQDNANEMEIAVALTPDEAQTMAKQMIMLHQLKSQDEVIADMYGPDQRHAFYDSVYELIGVDDATPYLANPQSPEYQQMQAQKAQQQKAMADHQMQMQMQTQETQLEAMNQQVQQGWAALNNKIMDTAHDNDLDDKKQKWQQYVDFENLQLKEEELEIEEDQERGVSIG